MNSLNRRKVLHTTAAAAIGAVMGEAVTAEPPATPHDPDTADRGFVMAAGMTDGEADCWALAAKTAGAFFDLPELHSMDKQEVATAIHVIQNKLLSRPTYRKYLETAKASHDPK
jgi:hypothetical protein